MHEDGKNLNLITLWVDVNLRDPNPPFWFAG